MNPIDIDLLKSLETLSSCYNDLISKYRELESKYFDIQINLSLMRSNLNDLTAKDELEESIINRIDELIFNSYDYRYIKKDDENEKEEN